MERFKDKEHLVRMALLFAAGIGIFVVARALMVPEDFGAFGHYRANALKEVAARPVAYAGRKACEDCHGDVVETRKASKHEKVACEACHGALAGHAFSDDPGAAKPPRPDAKELCLTCHLENVAKPQGFPQVDPQDHGDGGPCSSCHKPHHPEIS